MQAGHITSHPVTKIMGVLNVTPDSFSDGAQFFDADVFDADVAVREALQMVREGAAIIDVGGESTRPGATLVGAETEQQRVLPVISALAKELEQTQTQAQTQEQTQRQGHDLVKISIDTIRAETAQAAVQAGATIINDVSGGTYDPEMYAAVAELINNPQFSKAHDLLYIIGHWRGIPDLGNKRSDYEDVVGEVFAALKEQAANAIVAGVPRENIMLDPGIGFDKDTAQSWQLLRELSKLQNLGFPVCVGVSRKRMLADIITNTTGATGEFSERDLPTAIVTAFAARAGIETVRVHDVLGSAQALEVATLWSEPQQPQPKLHPSDKITLTGLEVFAHHGVFDFERENGQLFIIDIEVTTDMGPAIAGDALAETVHYGELADRVVQAVENDPVDLIETVADRVVGVALSFPAAKEVTVTVHKPDAPIAAKFGDVSVTMTRTASENQSTFVGSEK